jgi:hypothetical protein
MLWRLLTKRELFQQAQISNFLGAEYHDDDEMEAEDEPEIRWGEFQQQVGAVNILQSAASALEFFFLLFSMNIVNDILCEANKYAFQCLTAAGKEPNLFERITDTELLAYFGLCIAMSMNPVHSICDYWSQDWILGVPSLARIMTVARFETITRYLHVNEIYRCQLGELLALINCSKFDHSWNQFVQTF